nr:pre-mRNA-splicing factor cwc24-like [Penaeus vannamei]
MSARGGAADGGDQSSDDEARQKSLIAPSWQRARSCVCKKRSAARSRRRKRRGRASSLSNEEPSWLSVHSSPTRDDDDLVFSNTLRSDDSEEDRHLGASLRLGASGSEDGWSEYGIHLADLLRSLRVQDCHQQVPRARTSCRHSSDGSVVSHPSPPASPSAPSALRPHPHDLTKYKTELCRSFQYNGFCGYGESCLYAHGSHDLRTYPKHPMYRTKQCFSFHQKGYCLYGSRCQFLHDLE